MTITMPRRIPRQKSGIIFSNSNIPTEHDMSFGWQIRICILKISLVSLV